MDSSSQNWLETFSPFGAMHLLTGVACAAFIVGLCTLGKQASRGDPARERALRWAWITALVLVQGYTQIWWLMPQNFQLRVSLPLHFCDLAPWLAPVAMLTTIRVARTMLYFWAIALSTWAFITPILTKGPAHTEFWLFWIGHTQIVGSAFYVVFVQGFRPKLKDLVIAGVVTTGYSLVMVAFNIVFDLDYAYVGPSSTATAPLGPWPMRLFAIIPGQWLLFVLIWLPFGIRRAHAKEQGNDEDSTVEQ